MSAYGTKQTFNRPRVARSGSGLKADMPNQHVECPLMTQSGLCPLLSPQRAKTRCGWPLSGVLNSC